MTNRLIAILILVTGSVFLVGCNAEPDEPKKPRVTLENLKVAHAAAYHRALYYAAEAEQAETEHLENLAVMFRAIARSEDIHAAGHEALLLQYNEPTDTTKSPSLPVGSVRQSLKMGASLEATETNALYPPMIKAATAEQWPEAADQFTQFRLADIRQGEMIDNAQERRGVLALSSYHVCQQCGYIRVDEEEAMKCTVCGSTAWDQI